jgi:hypothetical protein
MLKLNLNSEADQQPQAHQQRSSPTAAGSKGLIFFFPEA